MNKAEIYRKAVLRNLPADLQEIEPLAVERMLFYGIRYANLWGKPESSDELVGKVTLFDLLFVLIEKLTPRQFAEIFPIQKKYNGEKWGTKDYFSTVQAIEEHGWDTLISDPFDFFWDYVNIETRIFAVNYMSLMDDIRMLQGKRSMIEEWAIENGITTYRKHVDASGREFMVGSNGRSFPIIAARARHLKIVSGRVGMQSAGTQKA